MAKESILEEAAKTLDVEARGLEPARHPCLISAMKLGIEALQAIRTGREDFYEAGGHLLPGETSDEETKEVMGMKLVLYLNDELIKKLGEMATNDLLSTEDEARSILARCIRKRSAEKPDQWLVELPGILMEVAKVIDGVLARQKE